MKDAFSESELSFDIKLMFISFFDSGVFTLWLVDIQDVAAHSFAHTKFQQFSTLFCAFGVHFHFEGPIEVEQTVSQPVSVSSLIHDFWIHEFSDRLLAQQESRKYVLSLEVPVATEEGMKVTKW